MEITNDKEKMVRPSGTPPQLAISSSSDAKDIGTTSPKPKFSAYIYACNVCGKQVGVVLTPYQTQFLATMKRGLLKTLSERKKCW